MSKPTKTEIQFIRFCQFLITKGDTISRKDLRVSIYNFQKMMDIGKNNLYRRDDSSLLVLKDDIPFPKYDLTKKIRLWKELGIWREFEHHFNDVMSIPHQEYQRVSKHGMLENRLDGSDKDEFIWEEVYVLLGKRYTFTKLKTDELRMTISDFTKKEPEEEEKTLPLEELIFGSLLGLPNHQAINQLQMGISNLSNEEKENVLKYILDKIESGELKLGEGGVGMSLQTWINTAIRMYRSRESVQSQFNNSIPNPGLNPNMGYQHNPQHNTNWGEVFSKPEMSFRQDVDQPHQKLTLLGSIILLHGEGYVHFTYEPMWGVLISHSHFDLRVQPIETLPKARQFSDLPINSRISVTSINLINTTLNLLKLSHNLV